LQIGSPRCSRGSRSELAGKISNPRDLLVLVLGELLHVERRLAGGVLQSLADTVADEELGSVLRAHLAETKEHVNRLEAAFRRIGVAPSAHLSRAFESAVAQHDELASTIVESRLADVFHAQSALHTEHWEIAAYTATLAAARTFDADLAALADSRHEEEVARDRLAAICERLAGGA
jgi:ferritin-like metal-binding protein YciE